MRFDSLTVLLAVSNTLLGASAGPLAAKRQDESSSITATPSGSSSAQETATSTSSQNQEGFVVSTLSDGTTTTFLVKNPNATPTADATSTETKTYTYSRTGIPAPISTNFPSCHAADAAPFCLPNNMSELYAGKTYFATWNPDFFPLNSTVTVKIQWTNDTHMETWSSDETDNSMGFVPVETKKEWLQGYTAYNLSFIAINFIKDDPTESSKAYDGPMITLMNEPARHYPEPPHNSIDREGLIIGLPIGLGFVLLVAAGLFFGMRKHRVIGLGNVMGRRNKGYGVGKSRRQRLGLGKGKKGAIRLEERDAAPAPQYHDERGHARGDSLGSLVSDDGIRPAPGNHFRDEIQRQRTGR